MPVGDLLRQWRHRRRLSQLDLACDAEISTRHLSFVETGRSVPSREMLLNLAERLQIPLRERNLLLMAAGYAPVFAERSLGDPALQAARAAVDLVLQSHEPYPAIAVDRHWTLIASNKAFAPMLAGIDASLLQPPVNVLRIALHPGGVAPRIANFAEWRSHLLTRLRHQVSVTADSVLKELLDELSAYPAPTGASTHAPAIEQYAGVIVPLQLRTPAGILSLFSTTTIFGTPVEITLSELAVESFFPADESSAMMLRGAARADPLVALPHE